MRYLNVVWISLLLSACMTQAPTPTQDKDSPPPTISPSTTPQQTSAPKPTQTLEPIPTLPDPSGYRWALVAEELVNPVDLQSAGDERLFIVEQRGWIRIITDGKLLPEPFLDLSKYITDRESEQGLLGLAFHPNYAENGRFFVNYTDRFGNTVITRFIVSSTPDLADLNSLRVILRFNQPYPNHNGGGIVFSPDGDLYIGTGDGGSGGDPLGNGQRFDTLLGKLLRIDVDAADPYAIPPDNPFTSDDVLPEIWAYGLRNPWRFNFDRLTGDLYIGDVGQNQWEEISYLPAGSPGGANFGWNIREGAHPYAGDSTEDLIDPIAEYDHSQGCSVTGGVVVRDPSLPAWDGVYLYGDYCTGTVWGLLPTADGGWQTAVLFNTDYQISAFGEDQVGRVYLVDYQGSIYRLESVPSS
jgi:glucose/arabinose dehydrogenase